MEAGDGPNTMIRILVNSKDAGGIIGKVNTLILLVFYKLCNGTT